MITEQFIRSGKAIFTVSNDKGDHYTFRVNSKTFRDEDRCMFFVSVLTGPDNLMSYTYMGMLASDALRYLKTAKSKYDMESKPVKVFKWVLRIIEGKTKLPDGYALQHAGRCGRCAKTLTDPISIQIGIGPNCRKKMGILL